MDDKATILVLTPVKDARMHLDTYFRALDALTYPRELLSLGFLEGDSSDGTYDAIARRLPDLERRYRRAGVWRKHFGFKPRLGKRTPAIQPQRRALLAKARNHLLLRALDDEQWVLWIDVDVVEYPSDVIETMLAAGKDIVHPNCVLRRGGRSFDRNAWRDQGRLHLDDLRSEGTLVPLDSVGGTMLLVRADVHRDGVVFPPFPYGLRNPKVRSTNYWQGEIETEGFGMMAGDAGVQCWGMPNLEIRHYEAEGSSRSAGRRNSMATPTAPVRKQPDSSSSPHIESPHIESPHVESPHVESPHVESPHIYSPHVHSPHVSPHVVSPDHWSPDHESPSSPFVSPHIRTAAENREHHRQLLDARIRTLPHAAPPFHGRGIVICAGGDTYFPCAWVCVSMLRRSGCTLPIELWYRGRTEMSARAISLMESLGVTCVDAYPVARQHGYRRLDSWEIKPFAVAYSSFREVLLLDADNVPIANPERLFDAAPYRQHGALFWPDSSGGAMQPGYKEWLDRRAWDVCGVQWRPEPELESGQLLIDKQRCWAPLVLTLHLNEHSDYYYEFFYGDKDTFHLAWRRLGREYGLVPHRPVRFPGTFQQHDLEGRPIFLHRNLDKWTMTGTNRRVPQFRYEDLCRGAINELRALWTPPMRHFATDRTQSEAQTYEELVATSRFRLVAPGEHPRTVTFLPDFHLSSSAMKTNGKWSIEEDKDGMPLLRMNVPETHLMRLTPAGVWSGRRHHYSRVIAELHPDPH